MSSALRTWLVHLYPPSWRQRYAAEFEALLEQGLRSPLDVLDVILGAMDAHLQVLSGETVSWRTIQMLNKLRTTILMVFAAYIGFIVAGLALVSLVDDSPMIPLMKSNLAPALAMDIIQAGSLVALLAVVVGGLPLAITAIRRALSIDRRSLGLLFVPVLAFLAILLYVGFMVLVANQLVHIPGVLPAVQPGSFPMGNRLVLIGLALVFVLGAIASTLAVWKVISRVDVEQESFHAVGRTVNVKIYQFVYVPAIITSFSMLVMLVATMVWGWLVFSALPDVFFGNYGLWLTNTQAWFYGILLLMGLCCLAAFWGLARGRSALATA